MSSRLAHLRSEWDRFDKRPVELPGFKLRALSAEIIGTPTPEQTANALEFAVSVHDAAPYWVGDILAHVESRSDWADELRNQIAEATGYAIETIHNITWVSRHVHAPERAVAPSFAHAKEVASLEQPEQSKYLGRARDEKLTRSAMRKVITTDKRTRVLDVQGDLRGMFRVVYAQPDWDGISIVDLCKLPVRAHVWEDAVLFLRVPASMVFENPGPREVIEAWGFHGKTCYVWDKVRGLPGHYSYVTHELLAVAGRGKSTPDVAIEDPRHDSVQVVRKLEDHGPAPEHFRKLIEQLYPTGPYVELFGRQPVDGWTVLGGDPKMWALEAAS